MSGSRVGTILGRVRIKSVWPSDINLTVREAKGTRNMR